MKESNHILVNTEIVTSYFNFDKRLFLFFSYAYRRVQGFLYKVLKTPR